MKFVNAVPKIKKLSQNWLHVSLLVAAALFSAPQTGRAEDHPPGKAIYVDAHDLPGIICQQDLKPSHPTYPDTCDSAMEECETSVKAFLDLTLSNYIKINPGSFVPDTILHPGVGNYWTDEATNEKVIIKEFMEKHHAAGLSYLVGNDEDYPHPDKIVFMDFSNPSYQEIKDNVQWKCTEKHVVKLPEIAKSMCDALMPPNQSEVPGSTCPQAWSDCYSNLMGELNLTIKNYNQSYRFPKNFKKKDDSAFVVYESTYQDVIQNKFVGEQKVFNTVATDPQGKSYDIYKDFKSPTYQKTQEEMQSQCKSPDQPASAGNGSDSTTSSSNDGSPTGSPSALSNGSSEPAPSAGSCALSTATSSSNVGSFLMLIPLGLARLTRRKNPKK